MGSISETAIWKASDLCSRTFVRYVQVSGCCRHMLSAHIYTADQSTVLGSNDFTSIHITSSFFALFAFLQHIRPPLPQCCEVTSSYAAACLPPAQRTYLEDGRWLCGGVYTFSFTCRYTHNKHVVSNQTCSRPHNRLRGRIALSVARRLNKERLDINRFFVNYGSCSIIITSITSALFISNLFFWLLS
jgi:hypothetical protein